MQCWRRCGLGWCVLSAGDAAGCGRPLIDGRRLQRLRIPCWRVLTSARGCVYWPVAGEPPGAGGRALVWRRGHAGRARGAVGVTRRHWFWRGRSRWVHGGRSRRARRRFRRGGGIDARPAGRPEEIDGEGNQNSSGHGCQEKQRGRGHREPAIPIERRPRRGGRQLGFGRPAGGTIVVSGPCLSHFLRGAPPSPGGGRLRREGLDRGRVRACLVPVASVSAPFFTREVFKTAGEFEACHPIMMRRSHRRVAGGMPQAINLLKTIAPFFTREVFKTAGEFEACHPIMMRRSPRLVKLIRASLAYDAQ